MKTTAELALELHELIEGWRPGEREWNEVKAFIDAVRKEAFVDGAIWGKFNPYEEEWKRRFTEKDYP